MRAVRAMRGARGCLSVVAARRAPPFGSDFGRQWCLCTKTARPTRFSTRKAVQGGAEGAWGLGSECCGQALRWRRGCAPVLRRQRCACERLTSRGVRGRVGFRFGRPVFWAGAGAEASVGGRRAFCRPLLARKRVRLPTSAAARADAGGGAVGPRPHAPGPVRGTEYFHKAARYVLLPLVLGHSGLRAQPAAAARSRLAPKVQREIKSAGEDNVEASRRWRRVTRPMSCRRAAACSSLPLTRFRAKAVNIIFAATDGVRRPGSRPENGPSETETDPTPYASRGQPLRTSLPSQNRCATASPSQRLTAALAPQPPRTL